MTTNEVATKNITVAEELIQEYMDGKHYEQMSFLEFMLIKYNEKLEKDFEYQSKLNQSVKSR